VTDLGLSELAAKLGSDVAVCLKSEPALITGRGEVVSPVEGFPPCAIVLANPVLPLATAGVYGVLGASQLAAPPHPPARLDFDRDFDKLIDHVRPRGNDLEPAAARLAPQIVDLLAALVALKGVRLVRLSGSGPTCFALFTEPRAAYHAAAELAQSHPDWWIAASSLGGPSR
jgi:4-diphosphocytidyl-2-C-methyl-D-erythritol kinase